MREYGKLTAATVSSLNKVGRYADGGGLYLQVSSFGTKAWVLRYMVGGKARTMGLGSVETRSLKEAREAARQARQQLLDGIDPIAAREGRKQATIAEMASRLTFKEAAARYIEGQKAGWKNAKHAAQWESTLATYAYPVIGSMAVGAVETAHVVKILSPIWNEKPETASRVRGRIESVLAWATAAGFRQGDNAARWAGNLKAAFPAKAKVRKVKHHDALPFAELPGFMASLREMDFISARALEFAILTAARTGEVIGATWPEIDLEARRWTIPAERMKAGRPHVVPLSARAVAILEALPRVDGNPHVFPGAKAGKGLSNMAMLELVRGLTENGYTVHGFRSTFRDWAGETTAFPRDVIEHALAHIVGGAEGAYRRETAVTKRAKLMEAWAGYCERPAAGGAVVPMAKGRAA